MLIDLVFDAQGEIKKNVLRTINEDSQIKYIAF